LLEGHAKQAEFDNAMAWTWEAMAAAEGCVFIDPFEGV
jgi:hypothetical protein